MLRWLTVALLTMSMSLAAPERLELEPAAVQLQGVTMVPGKPLCEWLGVEVTQADGESLQGRLIAGGRAGNFSLVAGAPVARVAGMPVRLPHVPLAGDEHLLVPLRFLAETFEATVGWDAATREVSLTRGDKSAIVPVPVPLFPVIGTRPSMVLGGWHDDAWLSMEEMAKQVRARRYTLYGLDGRVGHVDGAAPVPEAPGDFPYVELTPAQTDVDLVGVDAPWNPMLRPVQQTDLTQQTYLGAAREILRAKGLPKATPRLTQVLRFDLEGDGTEEVLLSATTGREGYPRPDIVVNDYSFIALRRVVNGKVRTDLLVGEFYARPAEFAAPNAFRVQALLDLNGDNRLEIVTGWEYYEGAGSIVFELRDGKPVEAFAAGMGA